MSDIIISEFMDGAAVDRLAGEFDVIYDPTLVDQRDQLVSVLSSARALIVRNRTVVDAETLDAGRSLMVVGRLGIGLDNIDLDECSRRGIRVEATPGANADAVAEYVVAAVLVLVRGVFSATEQVVAGVWPRTDLVGGEVAGRTLGLIGYGDIARRVSRRAAALGMDVIAHDPYLVEADVSWAPARRATFDEVVSEADALSIHVPLTESTRGLIGRDAVAAMKPTAVLVNTSRGGIVDERAVVEALRRRDLRGAALDVFETEPVTSQEGGMFAGVDSLILTPHIAGITEESNARVGDMVARAVSDVLLGGGG